MKPIHTLVLLAALAGTGIWLLRAADPPPAAAYTGQRSFAQPVRDNPVGQKLPATRSFLGAPPPMPHTFSGDRDGRYCLGCHARENRIEKRQQAIAPVPHPEFSQCQQCHVNGSDRSVAVFRENGFIGLDDPGKGTRAFAGAPPTIPHKTFMRDNCLACHGPAGRQRIATPHPFRSQCQQCHVSDASRNYNRPVPWAELDGQL
jgi:cytochrome c-type protein NapB